MGAAATSDHLFCPICNEEMVTLLQLNRHLDDVHKEIEEERQVEVKDWFKARMVRAKKFQPLAVLNQKLKGLDIFESNNEPSSQPPLPVRHGSEPNVVASIPPPAPSGTSTPPVRSTQPVDPDELIKKDHWQRRGYNDVCSDPTCGRRLGNTNGSVNCRHCGKLFCEEHTMYQMKLSRSANHEPVRGNWHRVCETCYKSREGYSDRTGFERSHLSDFERIRQEKLNKSYLEVTRLEKRLSRLTQLLANPPEETQQAVTASKRWSFPIWGQNDPRKALEQSVVPWEDDATVSRCPYCQQDFSQYTFRRHHCRTCGKVVCGDPTTGCSIVLGLNVASRMSSPSSGHPSLMPMTADINPLTTEKLTTSPTVALDIRLCKECNQTMFAHRDFERSISTEPPSVRAYSNLIQFERGIRLLLPRFQKLLVALQDPDHPPSTTQIADASRTRKRLMDSFTQFDVAARRIRDMPTDSPTQQRLQKAIYQQASQFLHLHMLPLKTLPNILKHATPHGGAHKTNGISSPLALSTANTPSKGPLAAIHRTTHSFDSSSQLSVTTTTSSISQLEDEEKSLREQLIILEEQQFMLGEMVRDASKRRKFDEVESLRGNLTEIEKEVVRVQGLVSGVAGQIGNLYDGVDQPGFDDGDGAKTPRLAPVAGR